MFNQENKPKFILNILLILCVTAIVIVALVMMQNQQPENQFSVTASGRVFVKPDIANLTLGVKTEVKPTAAAAVKENTQKMNEVITALEKLSIEEKDIKTTNYNLNPVYDWTEKAGQRLRGYEVSQNVTIKIRDLEKIGEAMAKSTEKGANQVGNIAFTIDDEDALKAQARDEAIAKAKDKAVEIAKKSGLKLGKIINVYENQVYLPGPYYAKSEALGIGGGGEVPAPEIQVGENEVRVEVTVVYEVK